MREIKLTITSNESDWLEYMASTHEVSPEHLVHQLTFSLLNLYVNGSQEDQAMVLKTLEKYLIKVGSKHENDS